MGDSVDLDRLRELYWKTQEGVCCGQGIQFVITEPPQCCGQFERDDAADEAFENELRPAIGEILRLALVGQKMEAAPIMPVTRDQWGDHVIWVECEDLLHGKHCRVVPVEDSDNG